MVASLYSWLLYEGLSEKKVCALWVMEHQRADGGLGIRHQSFVELDANLFWLYQLPDSRLVFWVRASRVPDAVPLPTIVRRKSLRQGQL